MAVYEMFKLEQSNWLKSTFNNQHGCQLQLA